MSVKLSQTNHFGIEVANTLQWDHWEPGGEYTKQIVLKNVNLKTKKLQYRIPNRRFFTTRYPQPIVLSSGASIKLPITFRPIEKNLHEDVIEFITKEGEFKVPMKALLPEAQLRLPNAIKFGMCAVKDLVKMSFQITNISDSHTVFQMLCDEPFTLNPSSGTLAPHTQCEIIAQFKPEDAYVYNVDAICVFGQDAIKKKSLAIKLEGIGKYPHLGIRYKTESGNSICLSFGDVSVRQQVEKTVELINYTPVDAPFQVLQKSRGFIVDNVFSCSQYHGIIRAESTLKLKIFFNPENIKTEYVDDFEILAVGLTSRSLLKCRGNGIGPDVRVEISTINFNTTTPGVAVTRSFKLTNHSSFNSIFQFQLDDKCSVFKLDTLSGIINANSTKTIIMKFIPSKPIVYFRRIFCIVHNQGALCLDVCGTCCTSADKPAILSRQHIENYNLHSQRGITRLSPDQILEYIEQDMITVTDNGLMEVTDKSLAHSLEKSPPALCTLHEYFNHSFSLELESILPHVSLDSKHIDFGMCRENCNFQKTISVNNHTVGKVSCSWMNLDKNIFTVTPSEADIEPLSSVSFMVNFRSNGPAKFYCCELEAFIFYKSMRDHRLIDERTITRPWCLTVSVSAHTFPKHAERFAPICKWEKPKLIFPPVTSTCRTVYRTCVLRNDGDNPIFYAFNEDHEQVFSCKPANALVKNMYQVIAFQMSPTSDENCSKNVICHINGDTKYDQKFECITTNEKPQVSLNPNDFVYFKPTCIGDSSRQTVTVTNTSRVKLNLHWKIAGSDTDMLKVVPSSCTILPNEIQKHEWLFIPSSTVKHLFKVKLIVSTEQEHCKKYELRFIGEGQDGVISCEENTIKFDQILVGCEEEKRLTLQNDSDCSLSYELVVEQILKATETNAVTEPALKATCECNVIPAHSKANMRLFATPRSASTYSYNVSYRLKSKIETEEEDVNFVKKGHLCTVTIKGTYPSLIITDVYGAGCVETFSKSFLWQLFRLDNLNTLLQTDPENQELKYTIASRHSTRRRMPVTTNAINQFDFCSSAIGSDPSIISLNLQNTGISPVEWALRYPTDMQLDVEFWAESGKLDDDEVHELYIMANELFSIEPRCGVIKAGENQIITFTYRHTSLGIHELPLLFKIVQGREIRGDSVIRVVKNCGDWSNPHYCRPISLLSVFRKFNLLGHTLESSAQWLHITSHLHVFSPVAIGQTSPVVQSYTLYNTSNEVVKYTFDTSPLEKLRQDNYDWSVLECLTPTGEIQPHDTALIHWAFSPLEARSYTVDMPLLIHGGEPLTIRFSGSGYDPNYLNESMLQAKYNENQESRIANEKQLVRLSTDNLHFDDIPLFCEEQQIIFLSNSSTDHTMSFYWDIKDTPAEGIVSISPGYGCLEPGKSTICKIKVFSYGPVAVHNFDIICKVTDETEMGLYDENVKRWQANEEKKKVLFTITDKTERRKTNSTLKMRNNRQSSSSNSLQRYQALPPIKSPKTNHKEASLPVTDYEPVPVKPRFSVLHLGVTVKTSAVQNWLKLHAAKRDEVFVLRYPLESKSRVDMSQSVVRAEELNTIQCITQCIIKDILLDTDFLMSLEFMEDEPIPYFAMLSSNTGVGEITSENALEHKETNNPHLKSLEQRQLLKRSDEMRYIIENVLENSILNIVSEDISLTQRGRILTKSDDVNNNQ